MDVICIDHPYLGQFTRSFLLPAPEGGVLIDTGLYSGTGRIAALEPHPKAVLSTHGHWDHTGGHRFFQRRGAAVYAHPGDERILGDPAYQWRLLYEQFSQDFPIPPARRDIYHQEARGGVSADAALAGGQELTFGSMVLRVIAVPGHSAGSVCIHLPREGVLFTGDTVCGGGFFKTIPQISSPQAYQAALERLEGVDAGRIYSAHCQEVWGPADYRERLRQGLSCLERLRRWMREFLDRHPHGFRLGEAARFLCQREGGKAVGSGACITAAALLREFSTQYEAAERCCKNYLL